MEGLVVLLSRTIHTAEWDDNLQGNRWRTLHSPECPREVESPPGGLEMNRTILLEAGICWILWRGKRKRERKQKELARWPKVESEPSLQSLPPLTFIKSTKTQQIPEVIRWHMDTSQGEDADRPGSGASEAWNTKWRRSRNHRFIAQATDLKSWSTLTDL